MEGDITRSGAHVTPEAIRPHLVECGYRRELLRAGYEFSGSDAAIHKADLVAFGQEPLDIRSACIAVIDGRGHDPRDAVSAHYELGAPVVLVCNGSMQRWRQTSDRRKPELAETIEPSKVGAFFQAHRDTLAPSELFKSKTIGRIKPDARHPDFVDANLLPAVEAEVGRHLTKRVVSVIDDLSGIFPRSVDELSREERGWIFESTFYLLAGKLLADKKVKGFGALDNAGVDEIFRLVGRHYGSQNPPRIASARVRDALTIAAEHFRTFRYLGHVTTDTLADVYEAALIDKKKRKALGTHSTPSYIVDWIVWQMLPWIEQMDADDRHVLEPACGHAPFLVSAMRLLRFLLPNSTSHKESHEYLKAHLRGLDKDDRASEVARLHLTLADVPNPNGWNLDRVDMFEPGVLESAAASSRILLCNPPFEEFTKPERAEYAVKGYSPQHPGKATELLHRTLPHLTEGAVFGVVLPQAILHGTNENYVSLREMILKDFQIADICLLNDHFFRYADHETALVIGRKTRSRSLLVSRFTCRKVRETDTKEFAKSYRTTTQFDVSQADVAETKHKSLWIPDLPDVWEHCEALPKLEDVADLFRGFNYVGKKSLPAGAFTYGEAPPKVTRGMVLRHGYAETDRRSMIHSPPRRFAMNMADDVVGVERGGTETGHGQILLNYIRVSRGPWRWKGFIDAEGCPFQSCYTAVRPKSANLPLEYLWAILNGPLANAFLYSHTMKRQNLNSLVNRIPIPRTTPAAIRRVVEYVAAYRTEASKPSSDASGGSLFSMSSTPDPMDPARVRSLLMNLDAEVLRLYQLPASKERELLDSFTGKKRPGLPSGVSFERYFPRTFSEVVPLHVYLSPAYAKRRLQSASDYMSQEERKRLDELTSAKLVGSLSPEEERELDALRVSLAANAYVEINRGKPRGQELMKAGRDADRRIAQIANRSIGRELKDKRRARQA